MTARRPWTMGGHDTGAMSFEGSGYSARPSGPSRATSREARVHPVLVDVVVGGASFTLRSYLAFLVLAALSRSARGRVLVGMGVGRRSATAGLAAAVLAALSGHGSWR